MFALVSSFALRRSWTDFPAAGDWKRVTHVSLKKRNKSAQRWECQTPSHTASERQLLQGASSASP